MSFSASLVAGTADQWASFPLPLAHRRKSPDQLEPSVTTTRMNSLFEGYRSPPATGCVIGLNVEKERKLSAPRLPTPSAASSAYHHRQHHARPRRHTYATVGERVGGTNQHWRQPRFELADDANTKNAQFEHGHHTLRAVPYF
uniref:Uncharacterized protein n=1 Tax=Mesocestoides corti TaxID=53468 RepID=A0A5K3FTB9_MESCO